MLNDKDNFIQNVFHLSCFSSYLKTYIFSVIMVKKLADVTCTHAKTSCILCTLQVFQLIKITLN